MEMIENEHLNRPCREKKRTKSESINESLNMLRNAVYHLEDLKNSIFTREEEKGKTVRDTAPICIDKPLSTTLDEAPGQIEEMAQMINEHIEMIRKGLF